MSDEGYPWPEDDRTLLPLLARLNERQRRFARAYLTTAKYVASRAAAEAGYTWPGQQGPRLTSFPAVRAVIEEGYRFQVARMDAEWRERLRRG